MTVWNYELLPLTYVIPSDNNGFNTQHFQKKKKITVSRVVSVCVYSFVILFSAID